MEKNKLQAEIIRECVACVAALNKDNWDQYVDIPYDDYANQCYNYGGSKLEDQFDELYSQSSDEELQSFYSDCRLRVSEKIAAFVLQSGNA